MKLKKGVCALLATLQIAAAVSGLSVSAAADSSQPINESNVLQANTVSSMPVIDGKLSDSVWNLNQTMDNTVDGAPEHSAKFDVLWDYTYLYIGVQVENDPELIAGDSWLNGDIVSLFIDPTQHKSAPYTSGDWQIGIGYYPDDPFNPSILFGSGVTATQEQRSQLSRNLLAATSQTETGWNAEIAIAWDDLGIDPFLHKEFGFDISADNKLSSHPADTLDSLLWETNGETSFWNNTAGFGKVILSDTVVQNTDSSVIFEENFDSTADGTLPEGFQPLAGQESGWTVENGQLVGDFGTSGNTERRIVLPALGDNFTYQADVTFLSAVNTGRWESLFYRAPLDNGLGYYHFTSRLNGAGEISVKGADNTWPTAFVNTNGAAPGALSLNQPYHLTINAFDQTLSHQRLGTIDSETFDYTVNAYDKIGASRPATMISDLQKRGRFGLQVDQASVAFDNIKIEKLEAVALTVEGLPDRVVQLETLPQMQILLDYSNGVNGVSVDSRDAKTYSSNPDVLRILEDGSIKALQTGTSVLSVIADNKLFQKQITVTETDRDPVITGIRVQNKLSVYPVTVGQQLSTALISFDATNEALETTVINGSYDGMAFSSSNEAVARVENGTLIALQTGVVTITASIGGASDSITVWVRADENDNLFLEESFESGLPAGWKQVSGSGTVKEESGNHYLELSPYTRMVIPMPEGVGDYTIEADVTYYNASNSSRWASLMYRVQNGDYPYYQMAVRQDATATNGVEFALRTPQNGWDVKATGSFNGKMDDGVTRRFKVTVQGDKVKEWIDGQEIVFTDKATDYQAGDVGLQSDNVTVRYDNLKVSLNPAQLPDVPKPENNFAATKTLSDNLVAAPTVVSNQIASLEDAQALVSDSVTSSLFLSAKSENDSVFLYSGSNQLGSLDQVIQSLYSRILLIFEVNDQPTADALAQYITENKLEDLHVASADGEILRSFREQSANSRASLILNNDTLTLEEVYKAVGDANTAQSKNVIIRQAAVDKTMIEQLQRRLMSVWVVCDDSAVGMYGAINAGANGIITGSPAKLAELAQVYTNKTVIRRSFIIGHRGTPGNAPENTMAGFKMSYETYGSQMIENDVYLTKDNRVIILHDDTFARTTDILTNTKLPDSLFTNGLTRQNCRPKDLTLDQIKLLDAGSYYGEQFKGEQVPTLDELFEYMKGKDILLFLELKDASTGIEQATVDLIKQYDIQDQVCAITFNQKSVPITQEILPTLSIGYLTGVGYVDAENPMITVRNAINQIQPMNATYNSSYPTVHNRQFVQEMQARGCTLWPWTYNDQASYAAAIELGINGITTNYANWASDYVFDLRAEQDAYSMGMGSSLALKAVGTTNLKNEVEYVPEIIVLQGDDVIRVADNTVTALKPGTATIMLRANTTMGTAAYDLYTEPVTITVEQASQADKKILQKVYDYAKTQKEAGALDNVIDQVAAAYNQRLDQAAAVLADQAATQTQVDEAWTSLLNIIHYLNFVKGNKDQLATAIEAAEAIDLDDYVEQGQAEFILALNEAKSVARDGNAMQDEVDAAVDKLIDAMLHLRLKVGDKAQLNTLVAAALKLDMEQYLDAGKQEFLNLLGEALKMQQDATVKQQAIDQMIDRLTDALLNLRLKPNKDMLGDLVMQANAMMTTSYTPESAERFQQALREAQQVLDNGQATSDEVTKAEQALSAAIESLEISRDLPESSSPAIAGDQTVVAASTAVKTGDAVPFAAAALTAVAGLGIFILRRKKR